MAPLARSALLALLIGFSAFGCNAGRGESTDSAAAARSSVGPGTGATANTGDCRDASPSGSTIRIAPDDEPGERLLLAGRVLDSTGGPVAGVRIYAYHTDITGVYSRDPSRDAPRLCGVLATDGDGAYAIRTIRPGNYPTGRNPAHVHFELSGEEIEPLVTEVYFEGDRFLDIRSLVEHFGEALVRGGRSSIVRPLVAKNGGFSCEKDFIVRRTSAK